GGTRPRTMRRAVVLPAPLGPSRPRTEPGETSRVRSSTAMISPKRLVRCSTATGGTASGAGAGDGAGRATVITIDDNVPCAKKDWRAGQAEPRAPGCYLTA